MKWFDGAHHKGVGAAFATPGRKALIGYLTVGYPSVDATLEAALLIASAGCDLIEMGIPFSDPLADGATIQKASFHALQNGVNTDICLEVAGRIRQKIKTPLAFMSYYNPLLKYGLDAFCRDCVMVGVNGLIIPDLPPEEGSDLESATIKHGLDLIYLLSPTSTDERIFLVAQRSRGFIYLVSLTGVTGARASLPEELERFVLKVRKVAKQPLCVGFGISTPEQARRVARIADGVIVGSRLIQLLEETRPQPKLRSFVKSLREALDG